jgi:TonB-dependent SusC/RagA subfamily outer membrane receptor
MKKLFVQIIVSSVFAINPSNFLLGQEKHVQGWVTTFDSIPLAIASIKVKSSNETVFTDTLGLFTVKVFPKDKLKIKAKGFSSKTVKIEEGGKFVVVNLKLKPGTVNRDLAIGYGHVRDTDKLNAVSNINEGDLDFSRYRDIYDIIIGRFPGTQVTGGQISIRGAKGSGGALLIVDGIEVDQAYFGSLPTADIADINVLKGAAASIYGVRGGNGVVIVETKRGKN